MSALKNCKTFGKFLYLHEIKSGDKKPITHTRIKGEDESGKKIWGGKYHVPDENMNLFWKLYHERVFVSGKNEYLTETQDRENGGPLLVDLDLRFAEEVTERQYDQEDIKAILELYCQSLQEVFDFNERIKFPVFVSQKKAPVCKEGQRTKDGIHMVWCINMAHNVQMILRKVVIDKEENEMKIFTGIGCVNDVEDIFDENIACGRGNWQVYGSRKPKCDAYEIEHVFNVAIDNDGYSFEMKDKSAMNVKAILPIVSAKNKMNKKILDFASLKQKNVQTTEDFKNLEKAKDQKKEQKKKRKKRKI